MTLNVISRSAKRRIATFLSTRTPGVSSALSLRSLAHAVRRAAGREQAGSLHRAGGYMESSQVWSWMFAPLPGGANWSTETTRRAWVPLPRSAQGFAAALRPPRRRQGTRRHFDTRISEATPTCRNGRCKRKRLTEGDADERQKDAGASARRKGRSMTPAQERMCREVVSAMLEHYADVMFDDAPRDGARKEESDGETESAASPPRDRRAAYRARNGCCTQS